MRIILSIILLFFCLTCFCQPIYYWKTVAYDLGVSHYQLQKSSDKINWLTIATVLPKKLKDSNNYVYSLPNSVGFYRIKAVMKVGEYYTKIINVYVDSNVVISGSIVVSKWVDSLRFITKNEINVQYYSIEKSTSLIVPYFTRVLTVRPKERDSIYFVNISRQVNKRPYYRVRALYKNGKYSAPILFQ